jgi:triacylglycerol esterase/lipase EstA (alpha/beta hydrolase family)
MDVPRTVFTFVAGLVIGAGLFQGLLYLVRFVRRGHARDADERMPLLALLTSRVSAFLGECTAFVIAMGASVWRRKPNPPAAAPRRRPVLLIHGYGLGAGSLAVMARRLRRDGWTWVWPVNHAPILGDIRRNVDALAAAVDEVRRLSGADRVDIVAHSMGGLVTRAFIKTGGAVAVHRVITLGTPHRGTVYGNLVGWADPMVGQMRIASAFLDELSRDDRVPDYTNVVSIYSLFDAVVVPPENAYYAGACNIQIDGVGHNALLLSRRVYELIRENLAADYADDFLSPGRQV